MSAERGKPVHLTNGERRLLMSLLESEVAAIEAGRVPLGYDDQRGEVWKFCKLRLRQYRRLIHELAHSQSTVGQYVVEPAQSE